MEPILITSDRAIFRLPRTMKPYEVVYIDAGARYGVLRPVSNPPRSLHRPFWSDSSVKEYLEGSSPPVSPTILWRQLQASLLKSTWFPNQEIVPLLVSWVIGTYFHQAFQSFPYLRIYGSFGSGKSSLAKWLSLLSFNGVQLLNPSVSSLFRQIEENRPTMFIDEQEDLQNPKNPVTMDLMTILRSGYSKGMSVPRQNYARLAETEFFDVYCPKVIIGSTDVDTTLASRTIPISMERARKDFVPQVNEAELQSLRDKLYILMLTRFGEIVPRSRQLLSNRTDQLMFPLKVIGEAWAGHALAPLMSAINSARSEIEEYSAQSLEWELKDIIAELRTEKEEVNSYELITELKKRYVGKQEITDQWLGQALRNLGIRSIGRKVVNDVWDESTRSKTMKKLRVYKIR